MAVCTQSKLHTLCFNDSHYCYGTGQRRNEDLSISSIRMATLSRELVAYEEGELERPKWSGKPLFLIWSSALFLQTPYLSPQARCPTSFSSGKPFLAALLNITGYIMEDSNMEDVEKRRIEQRSPSPPRKKIKAETSPKSESNAVAASTEPIAPSSIRHKINAHEGKCKSILFLNNSHTLVSGGKDSAIKLWDTSNGTLTSTIQGFQGTVCDLAISSDNSLLAATLTSNKLSIWDLNFGQNLRTMDYWYPVSTVAISRPSSRYMVNAENNRGIKLWDLQNDHYICGEYFDSNCNAICFTKDENTFCSGHDNGKIKFSTILSWSISHGSKMTVHTQPVTSICSLQGGNVMLTSGRDNLHNLVDVRSMQVCGKFRTKGNIVATKWSRTCVSPDENYVAVGSADGSVYVWSIKMGRMMRIMKEQSAAVLCCSWSGMGNPLASAHDDGTICVWT